ncbi:hypothetical protein [Flavobacterium sp. K5-23]|uniref:hypothetical protein n=1 Tax=Flavobacterium sp. K5-23 TaxID=2746225 RepID=UPI002010C099|nr:hypothetical protein [Flavobacterium sp. K5-23]UQD55792.1 hypothetical protein FLAK523_05020 [Flavobacterium sp. K5-23]
MNTICQIEIDYIKPSRSIETLLLKNLNNKRVVYVYNYEGWYFRFFNSINEVLDFFEDKFEPTISFEDEEKLDKFLENLDLSY